MNQQQEKKRLKCPPRAKPTQKPLENQKPSYQKGKKTSENWVYRHFRHDKIIIFNSSLMSIHITHHTYNIALTKKPFENIFYLRNSPVQPLSGKKWYGRACMILWCHGRGWKPPLTASQIHIECIQSVWAPWDTVYGPMGASLCCNTFAGGGGKWGMAEPVWFCDVMVEAENTHWLHPTSILDVYKVF